MEANRNTRSCSVLRMTQTPNISPLLPLLAGPLSVQLAFYGRIQLSSQRRFGCGTTYVTSVKYENGGFQQTPKAHGSWRGTPGSYQAVPTPSAGPPGATTEPILGYPATCRNLNTPCSLSLCAAPASGVLSHPLDGPCADDTSSLDTDLTRNTRAPHFNPQHWLLCHMGLY